MISRLISFVWVLRNRGPRAVWDMAAGRQSITFRDGGTSYHMANDGAAGYHLLNSVDKIRQLAAQVSPSAQTIVDIGAHSGLFSRFAAERAPTATIIAVEPDPGLRSTIDSNLSCVAGVRVIDSAVSDHVGSADFYRNPASTQTSSLLKSAVEVFHPTGPIETLTVSVTTLEQLWHDELNGGTIDVLKIDVQGAEGSVIAGGGGALAHVATLLIEVSFLDPQAVDLLSLLQDEFGPPVVVNLVSGGADLKFERHVRHGSGPI